jgi:murein DD-endopeptidase MepM/ murein hydrolase activator NlpD
VALKLAGRARIRVLLIVFITIVGLSVFLWSRAKRTGLESASIRSPGDTAGNSVREPSPEAYSPPAQSPSSSPSQVDFPTGEPGLSPATTQLPNEASLSNNYVGTLKLIIPVVGVGPEQLQDTFADARSEGRVHDAIDIPAPEGTPVVAAADGEIVKLFQSERGGTTIYQLGPDKKLVFYYAHLQGYADGLLVGKSVRQGEVIGYVGDTGNAGSGNYHLHFSIAVLADPKRYWEGSNINPYPLLRK